MKKTLLILASVSLFFASCSKSDDSGTGSTGGTTSLTSGKWVITSSNSLIQAQNTDIWALFPACQKDNQFTFNTNNTLTTDEGALKCDPNAAQQVTAGTWTLTNNDAQLTVSDGNTTIVSTVLTLDNNNLKIRYQTNYNNIPATTTTTYIKL